MALFHSKKALKTATVPPYTFDEEIRVPFIAFRDYVHFPGAEIRISEPLKLNSKAKKSLQSGKLTVVIGTSRISASRSIEYGVYGIEAKLSHIENDSEGQPFVYLFTGIRPVVITRIDSYQYGQMATADRVTLTRPRQVSSYLALKKTLVESAKELFGKDPARAELVQAISLDRDPAALCDLICPQLSDSPRDKLRLLGTFSILTKIKKLIKAIGREHELAKLADKIKLSARGELKDEQRKSFLREQLSAIQKELGEDDQESPSLTAFENALDQLDIAEASYNLLSEEIDRFAQSSYGSPDYAMLHAYLSFAFELPWVSDQPEPYSLAKASKILNSSHSGLDNVKDRILEYIATLSHSDRIPGQILLLNGPPGVGKTSLAHSIAEALNRPFARISLAGVSDEAELRGHRKTYIGAMPGKILQSLRQCESRQAVVLLDEIDKMGSTAGLSTGEASLLEILDPEQNNKFVDNYLGLPFDLSEVIFIATSNTYHNISEPLRDRLETIELRSYTQKEKTEIAERHILPQIRAELGLSHSQYKLSQTTLATIIDHYTREAGVRQLQKQLKIIGRKIVRKILEGQNTRKSINRANLNKWLGAPIYLNEPQDGLLPPGVSIGLAYTESGGDILYIESSFLPPQPNGRKLLLTGSVGKVMEESALTVTTYLSNLGAFEPELQEKLATSAIHLHLPDGATPKDGPSAGIAIMCAIASLATGRPVDSRMALTGEVTLRGQVLAVGGIKEKIIAAHRYQKTTVIIPKANTPDLQDVPKEVLKHMAILPVQTMEDVLLLSGIVKPTGTLKSLSKRAKRREPRLGASSF